MSWWMPLAVLGVVLAVWIAMRSRRGSDLSEGWQKLPAMPEAASIDVLGAVRRGELPSVPKGWRAFRLGVAGESQKNRDGTKRQDIIRRLSVGDEVTLECEPDNRHDKFAVRVMARHGQIGYLPRGHDCGVYVNEGRLRAFVSAINGGGKQKLGVVLVLVRAPKPRVKTAPAPGA